MVEYLQRAIKEYRNYETVSQNEFCGAIPDVVGAENEGRFLVESFGKSIIRAN
ncbi:MAG: hypothetical protein FWE04_02540 [Oscillospiraceae bacterium]|nr:hypothetical protein [Oscillospiraceae bacterium]